MPGKPAELPGAYYAFGEYVTRARWLTYFEQLRLILATQPRRALEIGVGPGVLKSVLRHQGCEVVTVDVNPALAPDVVADLRDLPDVVADNSWDWVVCSRVLHHVPKSEVGEALRAIQALDFRRCLLTVPREDLSLQVSLRRTAGRAHTFRVAGGAALKRALRRGVITSDPSGVWMLNGSGGISERDFAAELRTLFDVERSFVLADDPSHMFYVLGRR